MRLLLPGRKEGIARYILETTKRLVNNNPQHQFFFIFDRAFDQNFIFSKNVHPIVVGPQARHPWLWFWWFEYSLPRIFKKYKIDVLYSPEIYVSLRSKVPTLMVSHDIVFETFKNHLPRYQQRYLEKYSPKFHHRADHIITVSNFGKEDLIKKYDIQASKISIAGNACPEGFNPVDLDKKKYVQKKYSSNCPFILYVGAIHPRKNVLRMIKAFGAYKKSKSSNLKFLVVGRLAWKSKDVQEAIYNTNDVIYLDNIGDELKAIMATAEALLFTSLFEGFGIPILEAMSCGVPVITSNITAMKEVGADAALLVDPYSVEEISSAIGNILDDHSLRKKLVEQGLERIQDFSWESTSKHIQTNLLKLANNS